MEAGAAAAAQGGGHHEHGGALHLAGLDAQALPGLPLLQQFVADGHTGGAVLAVEAVLALDDAGMVAVAQGVGRFHQGAGHGKVRHGGELDGGVLTAGMLEADGAGGDDHIAGLDIQVDAAAGAHPDERIRAHGVELLHGDGGRGAADAGGADADLLPQQRAGVDGELPVGHHKMGVIQQGGNFLTAARVAGGDDVAAYVALHTVEVELLFQLLHSQILLILNTNS